MTSITSSTPSIPVTSQEIPANNQGTLDLLNPAPFMALWRKLDTGHKRSAIGDMWADWLDIQRDYKDEPFHQEATAYLAAMVSEADLTAKQLQEKYTADPSREHPQFPREDWQYEVENGDTSQGYWDWLEGMLVSQASDQE